jgi:hypothetical protein
VLICCPNNPENADEPEALLAPALFLISPLAVADFEYHGFTIDGRLLDGGQKASFAALGAPKLIEQSGIVESVGLPPEMLEFFKKTKILIDPALRGQPGIFSVQNGEGLVTIQPISFPANRPILLHELLPEFHRSHFLANPKKFFAVTGTIYLFGRIQPAAVQL